MTNNKLKIFYLLFVICYVLLVPSLFAFGKKDVEEPKTLNDEWILCVTVFDYSMMSPSRRITGDVITRDLVNKLELVSYRFRISPEYAYYESYAWQQELSAAAKAIANKQNERAQLLYRGEPNWKYRKNLKKIDEDLIVLEETYARKLEEKPLINKEPVFNLSQTNLSGTYPAPPKRGAERRFCQSQKSDAFLVGEIREFHNRYYIKLRLFALYTNSWIYEDDIIFSLEDIDGAVDEIAGRLDTVLAGNRPSRVAITVKPPESQILINQKYAGTGTVEARERPPGKVTIDIAADGFMPETVETELVPGEHADIDVTLGALSYANVEISVQGHPGATVYNGALYVGEAPLTLRLPINQLDYVTVKTRNGRTAKAVFATPDIPEATLLVSLKTKIPPSSGQKRVNKARSWYYWGWGATWFGIIAAWIGDGMLKTYNVALPYSSDPSFYDSAQRVAKVRSGAMICMGAAFTYSVFQMVRYLYIATEDATPIVKGERR